MSFIHKPSLYKPEHVVSESEMLAEIKKKYCNDPSLQKILKMVKNCGILKRHIIRPLNDSLAHKKFTDKSTLYQQQLVTIAEVVVSKALETAHLQPVDIDLIIDVSCSGFMMPSMSSYLINRMGFRHDVKKMPVAQLGCSAGASALLKAHDYIQAYPFHNVLIVAIELNSLCYQPTDHDVEAAICSALFGDGGAACVVNQSQGKHGLHILDNMTYTLPNSEHYIKYDVKDTGFHFRLDKEVMHSVEHLLSGVEGVFKKYIPELSMLDFIFSHTGGKSIMDAIINYTSVDEKRIKHSRASFRELGNVSSVSVLDVIRRGLTDFSAKKEHSQSNDVPIGAIFGIGPDVTIDALVAYWGTHSSLHLGHD
ncbi:hypothetical protein AB835_11140 [Candidatus Endobugula sertula]|uniref:Type III polyketide synthase n=1 Tax=Candidatus Endobugula sertula TaxID=62101 RepID=A0A1D2QN27_9GAMM|nr:hypothetical protein AB835_11140 [Candidatus Endobugula sertula]